MYVRPCGCCTSEAAHNMTVCLVPFGTLPLVPLEAAHDTAVPPESFHATLGHRCPTHLLGNLCGWNPHRRTDGPPCMRRHHQRRSPCERQVAACSHAQRPGKLLRTRRRKAVCTSSCHRPLRGGVHAGPSTSQVFRNQNMQGQHETSSGACMGLQHAATQSQTAQLLAASMNMGLQVGHYNIGKHVTAR